MSQAHTYHAFVLRHRKTQQKVRIYARPWKIGDDPAGDGKLVAKIQPFEHGIVKAEAPLLEGFVEEGQLLSWALQFLKDALFWQPDDTSDRRTLDFLLNKAPELRKR